MPGNVTESPIGNVSGRAQGLCSAIAGERDAENAGSIERLVISPREMEPSGAPSIAGPRPVSPTSQTPPVEVRGRKYLTVEEEAVARRFPVGQVRPAPGFGRTRGCSVVEETLERADGQEQPPGSAMKPKCSYKACARSSLASTTTAQTASAWLAWSTRRSASMSNAGPSPWPPQRRWTPEAPEQGDRDRIAGEALHGAFGQGLALDAAGAERVEPRDLLECVRDRDEDPRHVAPGVLRCLAAQVAVERVGAAPKARAVVVPRKRSDGEGHCAVALSMTRAAVRAASHKAALGFGGSRRASRNTPQSRTSSTRRLCSAMRWLAASSALLTTKPETVVF